MIRTSSLLFWFALTIAASVALYHTSDRVRDLNHKLREINASIENERRSIHVLKAEWVYLSAPSRVQMAARKHLDMRPTATRQVIALNELRDALPTRAEAMGPVAVTSTPIATIKTSLTAPSAAPTRAPKPVTAAESTHINDRLVIQRTASAEMPADSIGALINRLDSAP